MKTIIAGSREIESYELVELAMSKIEFEVTEVVCGLAKGVDLLGKRWALERNIPVKEFPADWDKHGRSAGPIRNVEMAKYADALVAIWDGKSLGTYHMIKAAKEQGLVMKVFLAGELQQELGKITWRGHEFSSKENGLVLALMEENDKLSNRVDLLEEKVNSLVSIWSDDGK